MPLLANIPPPPFSGIPGPLDIRFYGILIAIGAYLGLLLLVKRYSEMGGDAELAERTALIAVGAAIVGSRIGYVLPRLDHFLANPLEIPQIWQGGLAFFGGVALAVPVAWWYVHSKGGDVARMVDAAAPALPLGHAIGRWGNYFNQELYGRPTDLPWALEVEAHRRVAGFSDQTTFHPTFLYESLWNLALVGVLLWVDRRRVDGRRWLRRGSLGFLYLAGYGLGRFWTELLRIDTAERYFGLSRNNWNALLVIVIGIAGVLWWERRGRAGDQAGWDDDTTSTGDDDTSGTRGDTGADTGDDDETSGSRGDSGADTGDDDETSASRGDARPGTGDDDTPRAGGSTESDATGGVAEADSDRDTTGSDAPGVAENGKGPEVDAEPDGPSEPGRPAVEEHGGADPDERPRGWAPGTTDPDERPEDGAPGDSDHDERP